ncbi:hypothetical protein DFH29DRAFT_651295 [Suillus ampliporus]|nr:hypothetical protein DFH29DRAFT_651295 [Suillus ampliporus]
MDPTYLRRAEEGVSNYRAWNYKAALYATAPYKLQSIQYSLYNSCSRTWHGRTRLYYSPELPHRETLGYGEHLHPLIHLVGPLPSCNLSKLEVLGLARLSAGDVDVGQDWSHLNKRRQRAREETVERDLKWMWTLQAAKREAARENINVAQSTSYEVNLLQIIPSRSVSLVVLLSPS